jgi:LysM repeat protein
VLIAAVLASEGRFGLPAGGGQVAGTPVASAPRAQATLPAPRATQAAVEPVVTPATPQVTPTPATAPVAAAPTTQPTTTAAVEAETSQSSVSNARTTPPRTTGPFQTYRVQPGDTVRVIAQEFGVSTASIAQASGLRNADQLRVGQVLTIPNQRGYLYRIRPGETLDQIAARTGVPTELIVSASMLSDEMVQAGDVILIPDQRVLKSK